jgi:hypothetical protein
LARRVSHSTTAVGATAEIIITFRNELVSVSLKCHVTIINTEFGKPFTVDGFSQFMRDAITEAGLTLDCKPHGLRKTLGRRMADAGCSAHEIMAALGHTTLSEAERYTREADRRRGDRQAVLKLEAHKENSDAPNQVCRFGQNHKTGSKINVRERWRSLGKCDSSTIRAGYGRVWAKIGSLSFKAF